MQTKKQFSTAGINLAILVLAAVIFAGCARGPIEPDDSISELSVSDVRSQLIADSTKTLTSLEITRLTDDESVLWGGIIINTSNLTDSTQIEVMGYPLDRRQRPIKSRDAQGRFLIKHKEFLEPLDYAAGRSITVLGRLQDVVSGSVGEATYQYPALQSESLHLWSPYDSSSNTGFRFGIGINISN